MSPYIYHEDDYDEREEKKARQEAPRGRKERERKAFGARTP